ncbi:hypothetical protein PGB90_009163 [Kerria lacca]
MEDYERVLLVKNEVFVFKIPSRTSIKNYRAADWNLNEPQWSGRLRMVAKGSQCILFLEDKINGELFAKCPVESYPSVAIEAVSDSSRYFVIRIQDDNGRTAYVGLGFIDRSDSFDFNVALQDHFKWLKKTEEIVREEQEPKKDLDLRFKEGETIKINMKITKKDGTDSTLKSKPKIGTSSGILPPPPGSLKIVPPAPSQNSSPMHQPSSNKIPGWGDFTSAPVASNTSTTTNTSNPNWVQF